MRFDRLNKECIDDQLLCIFLSFLVHRQHLVLFVVVVLFLVALSGVVLVVGSVVCRGEELGVWDALVPGAVFVCIGHVGRLCGRNVVKSVLVELVLAELALEDIPFLSRNRLTALGRLSVVGVGTVGLQYCLVVNKFVVVVRNNQSVPPILLWKIDIVVIVGNPQMKTVASVGFGG